MANSIQSDLTISTAVSTLQNMLAPIGNFTLNVSNNVVGRSATVQVPVVDTDDGARKFDATKGYSADADSDVSKCAVTVDEVIKPFHLSDNELNQSPLSLQNYVAQNANEFGRYLLRLIFDGLDATTANTFAGGSVAGKAAASVAIADIKGLASKLDAAGAGLNRHLIINAGANSAVIPSTGETFGMNVVESGRFTNLYGMSVSPQNANNAASGKIHTFACPSDAIVIVNRMPDVQGGATLEEYTPFEVEGLGIQCAYRRYYDAAKGEHYAAFTSMYGVGIAKPGQIAALKAA